MDAYLNNTTIIYAIAAAAVALLIYWIVTKSKKRMIQKEAKIEQVKGEQPPPVVKERKKIYVNPQKGRVWDNTTRTVYDQELSPDIMNGLDLASGEQGAGRQYNRDGQYIYNVIKDAGKYRPAEMPVINRERSPEQLHFDLDQPEIPVIMNMKTDQSFIQQYGKILVWAGIIAFIIFLMVSSGRS